MYFANVGPKSGPILWRDHYGTIGVLASRHDPRPIGRAREVGWGPGGVALWKLTVRGVEVPGRWMVVSREFWPEEFAPRRKAEG
jgi:hypothetical protein